MTIEIRFDNGAQYERYMGVWSQRVGATFLDWLAPSNGLRWLDVGCGNGAFTELLAQRCAPASLTGIDPSREQLEFARARATLHRAAMHEGNAMALPFPDDSFDAAVMPLVIFFVPDPARGVSEMARVVRPGGIVSAYAWDMHGGGFPYAALQDELRALDVEVPVPPSAEASRLDMLEQLWHAAGLRNVRTRRISVERTFDSFDDYWTIVLGGPSVASSLASITPEQADVLRSRLRDRLPADDAGRLTYAAHANAVMGEVASEGSDRFR
jgi:SAM-dependent methyltransferase